MHRFSRGAPVAFWGLAAWGLVVGGFAVNVGACTSDSGVSSEKNLADTCGGATVDDHGFCRRTDGTFAKVACCATSEACAQATVDAHGICRRKDNGQFAPTACCDALCEGTSLDADGRCRKDNGTFALGACCADECAAGGCDVAIDEARFADDLRDALVAHYDQYGADITASGGSSLADAQAAVDASLVVELVDLDDDPEGHDLSLFRVFSHPDVVFPGSDIVWFGAYDQGSGALEAIYRFN